ncbi:MAG: class I SAM-dependent methyltransferase [Planctomycetota bacterium]
MASITPDGPGYELIDSGGQRKLERFGDEVIARPCAQAVWRESDRGAWKQAHGSFTRESSGTGTWSLQRPMPSPWKMKFAGIHWELRPNDFGHVGIFPEQEACWRWIDESIRGVPPPEGGVEILNLFGYTGGSTLVAAAAGAQVCHIDASRASVRHARVNAALSGLEERPVRWIAEDAMRFVERELRRGRRYHGIILDPPTYGRGAGGEVWRIEEDLVALLAHCRELLADRPLFLLLSSHSPGFTPLVLANLLGPAVCGEIESGEMTLRERSGRLLPSGAYARWRSAT